MIDSDISGLLIDGIPGTGKSSVLAALLTNVSGFSDDNSLIVLNEFQTQRVLEHKFRLKTLTKEDSVRLLETHLNYILSLNENLKSSDWCNRNQTAHRIKVIFERFHFSHQFLYSDLKWSDFVHIDRAMKDLNFSFAALTISRDEIHKRLIDERRDNNNWMNYISRFGRNENEIVDSFSRMQEIFLESYEKSSLPKMLIDTSNKSTFETTNEIINFWKINSGF